MAVQSARTLLNLPYYAATMSVRPHADGIEYDSRRNDGSAATLSTTYRAVGPRFQAIRGSLEYFLTERYCLYNLDRRANPFVSRFTIHRGRCSQLLLNSRATRWPMRQEWRYQIRSRCFTLLRARTWWRGRPRCCKAPRPGTAPYLVRHMRLDLARGERPAHLQSKAEPSRAWCSIWDH